jgi:hypothetical protein
MRDDLLDAQAAVDWAVAQIPCLEERLVAYLGRRPYDISMEPDPDQSGHILMVFHSLGAPDAVLNAEVGAIVNSLRTSLDLLFTALVERNTGMEVRRDTYFPILPDASNFLGTIEKHEAENRLSSAQAVTIKNIRPYKGGNDALYLLHHLDLKRKHRKLIEIRPRPGSVQMPMYCPHTAVWNHLEDKSVLLRFPPGTNFLPTKDNTQITLQIVIYEPGLGIEYAPVIPALHHLAEVASGVIAQFDTR